MYKKKTFVALIPARGGSKGIPNKNIKLLNGKPLIAWSIQAANKSKYIDQVAVTTDDSKIVRMARNYRALVPFVRPKNIAGDKAKMMDVILHFINFMDEQKQSFDYLVLLQPTAPLRNHKHIDEAIELLFKKKAKVILGVTEVDHPPMQCNQLPADSKMDQFYDKKYQKLNRQDLPSFYRLNGAVYIANWEFLKKQKRWFSNQTYAYKMDKLDSVDINDMADFWFAETLIKKLKR